MRFNPEMHDTEVGREFKRFFDWTGRERWRKKVLKYEQLPSLSVADVYRDYLRQRNPLAVCVAHYLNLSKQGKTIWKHLDAESLQMCAYIKLLNRIAQKASKNFLNRLRGNIFDDESIKGFLFELQIAIHFFNRGYDVRFVDLEGSGNYDLLVSKDDLQVEIECKRKSIDAGRKIRKGDFYLLADILFAELKDTGRRLAVLIKSEGRMGADQTLYGALANTVKELLRFDRYAAKVANLKVEIRKLPEDLRIKSELGLAEALVPLDCPFAYYAVASGPESTTIVRCESAEANKVLDAIYDDLKTGASQFSGKRPSFLSCLIEEIEDKDWEELQKGSGLQAVAARLFRNPSRQHVNLLTFSSDRTPPKRAGNVLSFSATNFKFVHPDPKFPLPKSFL